MWLFKQHSAWKLISDVEPFGYHDCILQTARVCTKGPKKYSLYHESVPDENLMWITYFINKYIRHGIGVGCLRRPIQFPFDTTTSSTL